MGTKLWADVPNARSGPHRTGGNGVDHGAERAAVWRSRRRGAPQGGAGPRGLDPGAARAGASRRRRPAAVRFRLDSAAPRGPTPGGGAHHRRAAARSRTVRPVAPRVFVGIDLIEI